MHCGRHRGGGKGVEVFRLSPQHCEDLGSVQTLVAQQFLLWVRVKQGGKQLNHM